MWAQLVSEENTSPEHVSAVEAFDPLLNLFGHGGHVQAYLLKCPLGFPVG